MSLPPSTGSFRARAFLLGLALCFPVAWVVSLTPQSNFFSMPVAPIGVLLGLLILNFPLRKLAPKWAMTQADLIVVFAIVSICSAIGAEWGRVGQSHTYQFTLDAASNPTAQKFVEHLPASMTIRDPNALKDIQTGGHDLAYTLSRLPLYLPKWILWGFLVCSVMFAMLCINSLMRGAWTEKEKLAFPLIQLPMEMTDKGGGGAMWRSKAMWIAFGIMFAIDMLNGFNYLYPNLPALPVKEYFDIGDLFKDPPWSNIGEFHVGIYPFMAALGIFMPSDLILSVIVFFLLRKASHVVLASYGIPQETFSGSAISPGPPYFDEQSWGGVFALFAGAMWVSRSYLREVWRDIRQGITAEDGGISHRFAFLGLVFSVAVAIAYGMYGGLPAWYMIPYVLIFLIFCVVITRLRAQLGPPTHEFAYFGPTALMNRFVGNRFFTEGQATWLSAAFLFMNRYSRTLPMPFQLEAMKMGRLAGVRQKGLFWSIACAIVLGFLLTYFFQQAIAFRLGHGGGTDAPTYLNNLVGDRHGPDAVGIAMTVVGFLIVLGLDAIRFRVPGFPLHPAGYVLAINFGVDYYWMGLLLALLVKTFVQRYYGLRGYDKLRSVALGLLLGEYAAETIWMLMAAITKHSTYTISFNPRTIGGF
ncbi:MAG TPA: DUF6785 family protein [Fimbriimonadaceae bacterium]|nr:DUF6785 family protein [Fimbriimonadaceae bacterium]